MDRDSELEYIMNSTLYNKYKDKELSSKTKRNKFLEDKKFYRKRIMKMAKDCTKYGVIKDIASPPTNLVTAYDQFAEQCIQYFINIDETDYYQMEYDTLNDNDKLNDTLNDNDTLNGNDTSIELLTTEMMRKPMIKKVITMDDFVNTKTHFATPIVLPREKIINIKDKKYRTKGLGDGKK